MIPVVPKIQFLSRAMARISKTDTFNALTANP